MRLPSFPNCNLQNYPISFLDQYTSHVTNGSGTGRCKMLILNRAIELLLLLFVVVFCCFRSLVVLSCCLLMSLVFVVFACSSLAFKFVGPCSCYHNFFVLLLFSVVKN